jgi:uncharacterized protein (DUF2252 family)
LETQQQSITSTDVVRMLESLEAAIKASSLAATHQEELLDYLRPAKREAAKESPSKDLVRQNLKQSVKRLRR